MILSVWIQNNRELPLPGLAFQRNETKKLTRRLVPLSLSFSIASMISWLDAKVSPHSFLSPFFRSSRLTEILSSSCSGPNLPRGNDRKRRRPRGGVCSLSLASESLLAFDTCILRTLYYYLTPATTRSTYILRLKAINLATERRRKNRERRLCRS